MNNVPTGLKIEFESVPIDLKKLTDVVVEEVVKQNACNTIYMKVNNLEKNIPDAATLIQQINTIQRNKIRRKEIGDVGNKVPGISGLETNAALNIKISGVEDKISDISKLIKKADYDAKIKDIDR